jgi:hypothetical protein
VEERTRVVTRFNYIVQYFEAIEPQATTRGYLEVNNYNRPALVRLTFEYACPPESQDKFLYAFFNAMALVMMDNDGLDLNDDKIGIDLHLLLFGFAHHLLHHFFLPCMLLLVLPIFLSCVLLLLPTHLPLLTCSPVRASILKTPQPSPVYHAAVQRAQGQEDRIQNFVGTPEGVS